RRSPGSREGTLELRRLPMAIEEAVPSSDKSTNVRSLGAAWRAASLRALGFVSSDLAGRWLTHQFMTPPAARHVPPKGRAVFEEGCPFTTSVGGVTIRGAFWGDGPRVYLLHGWGGRATQFAAFVEPLVRAGFMPVAFDAPGHGASGGRTASLLHFARALA